MVKAKRGKVCKTTRLGHTVTISAQVYPECDVWLKDEGRRQGVSASAVLRQLILKEIRNASRRR